MASGQQQATDISTTDIIDAFKILGEQHSIRLCLKEALQAGAVTGACAMIGALFGPPGILIGAAVGGVVAYSVSVQYMSLSEAFEMMTDEEKEIVARHLRPVLQQIGITSLELLKALAENAQSQEGRVCVNQLNVALKKVPRLQNASMKKD